MPDYYRALFKASESYTIFLGLSWFQLYQEHIVATQESIFLLGVESASSANATLPMALFPLQRSDIRLGFFVVRRLQSLTNYYSGLYGPVCEYPHKCTHASFHQLRIYLEQQKPSWDMLDLYPLSRETETYQQIISAFKLHAWILQETVAFGNWYLKVDDSCFQDYWLNRPSRLKNTVIRKWRQLNKLYKVELGIVQDSIQLQQLIPFYWQIYKCSWKPSESHPLFIDALLQLCADRGWLRLGFLRLDDKVVAVQFWIVHNSNCLIYKLAQDPGFDKFSVGSILTKTLMEYVIDIDKVIEVDFLMGDEPYKRDWMSHRRLRWRLTLINSKTMAGKAMLMRNYGAAVWHKIQNWVKSESGNTNDGSIY